MRLSTFCGLRRDQEQLLILKPFVLFYSYFLKTLLYVHFQVKCEEKSESGTRTVRGKNLSVL
jgi:hypothetical protein